jgi:hypothetical protein
MIFKNMRRPRIEATVRQHLGPYFGGMYFWQIRELAWLELGPGYTLSSRIQSTEQKNCALQCDHVLEVVGRPELKDIEGSGY